MNTGIPPAAVFTRPESDPVPVPITNAACSKLPRPLLDYDVSRDVWYLRRAYTVRFQEHALTMPRGFTLNLASVPRVLWWFIASFELGMVGPLAHDFLYGCGGDTAAACDPERSWTRKEADDLFLELMKEEGVPAGRRRCAYLAVRLFGFMAWKGKR